MTVSGPRTLLRPIRRALAGVLAFQLARPGLAMVLNLPLLAALLFLVSQLGLKASYVDLLPNDSREVEDLRIVGEAAGGTAELVAAVGGGTREARVEFARRLRDRLAALVDPVTGRPATRYVTFDFPTAFLEKRALWLIPLDELERLADAVDEESHIAWARATGGALAAEMGGREEIEALFSRARPKGLPRAIHESLDGEYVYVFIQPVVFGSDVGKGGAFLSRARAEVAAMAPEVSGLRVRFAGAMAGLEEQQGVLFSDLTWATGIAAVLCLALLWGFTRRAGALVLIGVPLLFGVLGTLAFARLSVGHLNIISGFLSGVLLGLGIDFGIHLYARFAELYAANAHGNAPANEGMSPEDHQDPTDDDLPSTNEAIYRRRARKIAVRQAVEETFTPALVSAATTAVAFGATAFAEFKGYSEYGAIAGVGVMVAMLLTYWVFPPLAVLWPLAPHTVDSRRLPADSPSVLPLPASPARPAFLWAFVAVVGGFLALCLWFAPSVRFHNDFKRLKGESPAGAFYEEVEAAVGRSLSPAVFLVRSLTEAGVVETVLDEFRAKSLPDGSPSGLGMSLSAWKLIPADRRPVAMDKAPNGTDASAAAENGLPKTPPPLSTPPSRLDEDHTNGEDTEARRDAIDRIRKAVLRLKPERRTDEWGQRLRDLLEMTTTEPWDLAEVPRALRDPFRGLNAPRYDVMSAASGSADAPSPAPPPGTPAPPVENPADEAQFVLVWPRYAMYDESEIRAWDAELHHIRAVVEARLGTHVPLLDENIIMARILAIIDRDGPFLLAAVSAVVFVLLWIDLGSVFAAAGGLALLGAMVAGLLGFMGLTGHTFTIINIVALPTLVGMGIDNAVHLSHRRRALGPGRVAEIVATTGRAALLCSTTTAVGFGSCMVAHHAGVRGLGELCAVGMGMSFLFTGVGLPTLWALVDAWRVRRHTTSVGPREVEP